MVDSNFNSYAMIASIDPLGGLNMPRASELWRSVQPIQGEAMWKNYSVTLGLPVKFTSTDPSIDFQVLDTFSTQASDGSTAPDNPIALNDEMVSLGTADIASAVS